MSERVEGDLADPSEFALPAQQAAQVGWGERRSRLQPSRQCWRVPLVVVAPALMGMGVTFRGGLALEFPATTVVVYEHLILSVIILPILVRIPRRKLSRVDVVSLVVIGAGASALATGMFTASFRYGEPNTVLLQKLQPLVAVAGAHLILKERVTPAT